MAGVRRRLGGVEGGVVLKLRFKGKYEAELELVFMIMSAIRRCSTVQIKRRVCGL